MSHDSKSNLDPRRVSSRIRKACLRHAFSVSGEYSNGTLEDSQSARDDDSGYLEAVLQGDLKADFALSVHDMAQDYPEPQSIEEALATPDAEMWQAAIGVQEYVQVWNIFRSD